MVKGSKRADGSGRGQAVFVAREESAWGGLESYLKSGSKEGGE